MDMDVSASPGVDTQDLSVAAVARPEIGDVGPLLGECVPANEEIIQAEAHWHKIRGHEPVPYRRSLDPLDFPTLLRFVELIEVLDGGRDFRYRLIGDEINRISRGYYAGRKVSEIPSQRAPSRIFALYAQTVRQRRPICVRLPYVGDDPFIEEVEAITMPLTENGSAIATLWGVVVPIPAVRDGR